MSESKATPRPWRWSRTYEMGNGRAHWCLENEESAAKNQTIDASLVLMLNRDDWLGSLFLDNPNVRLIVTAVNAHDDLLAACKAAYSLLRKLGGKNHDPEFTELAEAIDKAERETI